MRIKLDKIMKIKHYFQIIKICKQHFNDWIFMPFIIPFSKNHLELRDGRVIGFATHGLKKLRYIAIDKNNYVKGLGTKMMYAINDEINHLRIEPNNKNAERFFTKHHFNKTGQVNTLFGPRIIMRRK